MKLAIQGLKKSFGDKKVLRGIDLQLETAESLVVIGGSGCGKSILLKCIIGLVRPDSGSIRIDGEELTTMSHKQVQRFLKKLGMLFQGSALFDSLRVWGKCCFWSHTGTEDGYALGLFHCL